MKYGVDAIRKFNTRTEEAILKDEDGKEIAWIPMARLPLDELMNYISIFEKMDKNNPNAMFNKDLVHATPDLYNFFLYLIHGSIWDSK